MRLNTFEYLPTPTGKPFAVPKKNRDNTSFVKCFTFFVLPSRGSYVAFSKWNSNSPCTYTQNKKRQHTRVKMFPLGKTMKRRVNGEETSRMKTEKNGNVKEKKNTKTRKTFPSLPTQIQKNELAGYRHAVDSRQAVALLTALLL